MVKSTNLLRRQIINKIIYWTPRREWTGEYMEDANSLLSECQYLLPYVNVLYHRMQTQVTVRERDSDWENCFPRAIEVLCLSMRDWLLASPYLKHPIIPYYDPDGTITRNTKIRMGYLHSGSPKVARHFDIETMENLHPYWLGKVFKQPRIADLFSLVTNWGNPYFTVSLRGVKKEEQYAFISAP